jgi:hypothetical protein
MAPTPHRNTPSRQQAATPTVATPTQEEPTWNYAKARLPPFLAALKKDDRLFQAVHGSLSLYTRGYLTDSKGFIIVENDKHLKFILDNPDNEYTFEQPSPANAYPIADHHELLTIRRAIGIEPPDVSGMAEAAAATAVQAAADIAKEIDRKYKRSVELIRDKDRESASYIQGLITNESMARDLIIKYKYSGREVLRKLNDDKSKISDKAKKKLGESFDDRKDEGMHSPTVDGFNGFINDLVLLNEQLKRPKSFLELGDFYLEAARDALGDIRRIKLDIVVGNMTQHDTQDWLDELIDVINTELTDLEDDDERDNRAARP